MYTDMYAKILFSGKRLIQGEGALGAEVPYPFIFELYSAICSRL